MMSRNPKQYIIELDGAPGPDVPVAGTEGTVGQAMCDCFGPTREARQKGADAEAAPAMAPDGQTAADRVQAMMDRPGLGNEAEEPLIPDGVSIDRALGALENRITHHRPEPQPAKNAECQEDSE